MTFKLPTFKQVGLGLIGGFFLIQIVSLLLTTLIPSIPLFHGGSIILLMLAAVAVMSIFILGINVEELKTKENLIFVIIVFGLLAAAYFYLPQYFPQLFSISPDASGAIRSTIGAIVGSS